MSDHTLFVEIIQAVAFSANGEYLYCGSDGGIQVWQVEDGKELATMGCGAVCCLAVSQDGRWIAAGVTEWGQVFAWDAKTYEKVLDHSGPGSINGVDFSPDSTQLLVASHNAATVWDVASFPFQHQAFQPLQHKKEVIAAKYSPPGDRIATATHENVRVYTSHGQLLADINLRVIPKHNTGLLWFNTHLFILSDNTIKQVDLSTHSVLSEWTVPDSDHHSSISLSPHQEFITYSSKHNVTFWHTSTHSQVGSMEHDQRTPHPIAFSPDGRFLVIGGGEITTKKLSRIIEPDIQIDTAVLDFWKNDRLVNAEELLTNEIAVSQSPTHHLFASRALVRTHLQNWDHAIDDAEKSIEIQPSAIGYIAKSIALFGKGKRHEAYRACDTASEYSHSSHASVRCLLLMKAIIVFIAGEYEDAISRVGDLIGTVGFDAICHAVRTYMYFLLGNLRMESGDYEGAVQSFERAQARIRANTKPLLLFFSVIFGWKFDDSNVAIRQRHCEALYAAGRTEEAEESLLKIIHTDDTEADVGFSTTEWVFGFIQRCLSAPSSDGTNSKAARQDDLEAPTTLASVNSMTPTPLLREWVKATLVSSSWSDALAAAVNFKIPRFMTYRAIFENLETTQCISDASQCLRQMVDELGEQITHDEETKWIVGKLGESGDIAARAERYDDAILQYSTALSFDPTPPELLVKRSEAYIAKGLWKDALNDANRAISLDESSPWGYERKHAALHKAGDYDNAIDVFEVMLSKISESADANICNRFRQYVDPVVTRETIRKTVQNVIRDSPRVLIHTISGRLCNKTEQAASFESLSVFKELISSMTMSIDHKRIKQSVTEYYRYAMFSHRWEENEPLFGKIIQTLVYDLEKSPTHDKLQMFCKIVQDAGFSWAWSDTCCINKSDHFVLQEALVAMFRWYEAAAVTIIYLLGVHSPSQPGDLVNSVWNTRAWTFQEYHASKVVRFYTQDWKPYLNLDIPNHKESPEIISEMEKATHVSAETLMLLRPGLDNIREKLCLASRRRTTLIEDAAYSLLGIFSVSLPVIYGEGDKALGRLLAQLLTNSGEMSILAWTGKSGNFNSCLPANIAVFNDLPTTHIPITIRDSEMELTIIELRNSSLDLTLAMELYDRLHELSLPWFSGQRMKLPCLIFRLRRETTHQSTSGRVFRAKVAGLGNVEIRTTNSLFLLDSLVLVHPWIDFLLDRQPIPFRSFMDTLAHREAVDLSPRTQAPHFTVPTIGDLNSSPSSFDSTGTAYSLIEAPGDSPPITQPIASRLAAGLGWQFGGRLRHTSSVSLARKRVEALQVIARLRQPFGALLFARTRRNVEEYRRVATDSMIRVQIQEDTPLEQLIDAVRMLDVL